MKTLGIEAEAKPVCQCDAVGLYGWCQSCDRFKEEKNAEVGPVPPEALSPSAESLAALRERLKREGPGLPPEYTEVCMWCNDSPTTVRTSCGGNTLYFCNQDHSLLFLRWWSEHLDFASPQNPPSAVAPGRDDSKIDAGAGGGK